MLKVIIGDLMSAPEKYLVHQTNAVSHFAAGIADTIFTKYPYANVYATRMKPDIPGDIIICGNGQDQRYVVNLMGQYYPGGPGDVEIDNVKARQQYFHKALQLLAKTPNLEGIAFPYKIGCGIAQGNWEWYKGTISNFADYIYKKQGAKTVIYQREGDI